MADVFKARQLDLKRIVALKMLRNWARAGEKHLTRFRAEADVIAKLQHPNIVQIYDVGDVDGRPYFVLEYVAGGNLAQYLNGTPQERDWPHGLSKYWREPCRPRMPAASFIVILSRRIFF